MKKKKLRAGTPALSLCLTDLITSWSRGLSLPPGFVTVAFWTKFNGEMGVHPPHGGKDAHSHVAELYF